MYGLIMLIDKARIDKLHAGKPILDSIPLMNMSKEV